MVIVMRFFSVTTASILTLFFCSSAYAVDLTPEEINALFQKQIDVQKQPLTRSINGSSTRGMKLLTVKDVSAEPVAPLVAPDVATTLEVNAPQGDTSATASSTILSTTANSTELKPLAPLASSAPDQPLVYAKYESDLQVNLHIKFGFDSAALANSEKDKLSTICIAMKSSDIPHFSIIGHTDTSGADSYNERLSVMRAKEVARHLVETCAIPAERLQTIGMGERFPLNEDNPRADENRRVEFQAIS